MPADRPTAEQLAQWEATTATLRHPDECKYWGSDSRDPRPDAECTCGLGAVRVAVPMLLGEVRRLTQREADLESALDLAKDMIGCNLCCEYLACEYHGTAATPPLGVANPKVRVDAVASGSEKWMAP